MRPLYRAVDYQIIGKGFDAVGELVVFRHVHHKYGDLLVGRDSHVLLHRYASISRPMSTQYFLHKISNWGPRSRRFFAGTQEQPFEVDSS
jgi:hypothetical protein